MEQKTLTPEEQKRVDDFAVELKKVCTNFKLDLVPVLHFSEQGVVPVIKVIPFKEENKEEENKKEGDPKVVEDK